MHAPPITVQFVGNGNNATIDLAKLLSSVSEGIDLHKVPHEFSAIIQGDVFGILFDETFNLGLEVLVKDHIVFENQDVLFFIGTGISVVELLSLKLFKEPFVAAPVC